MSKYFFIVFVIWINLPLFAQFSNYNVGDTVNDFTVTDTQGDTYTLYDLLNQGKYVYIEFFATNCGTCQSKTPIFNAFYDKYGCNAGDVFCIAIEVANHDNIAVINFEQQYGGSTNHAPAVSADGGSASVATDFGVSSFPIICAIDPSKKLIVEGISPVNSVHDIAQTFPRGFNPPVMTCSNTAETNYQNIFRVYPNPAQHILFIHSLSTTAFEFAIYTMNGLQVFQHKYYQQDIIIDLNLNSGLYLIKFKSGKKIQYQKLVID